MVSKTTIISVLLVIGVLLGAVGAALVAQYWYLNIGQIGELEMYLDEVLYSDEDPIDWGTCQPGYTYVIENMTVLNMGNTALNVSIITDNLPTDWTLTWTANSTVLQPSAKVEASLDLSIPESATTWGSWGFYLIGCVPA